MVDLPKKKVGIIACSGEELAEGTVTRLVALRVLERLRGIGAGRRAGTACDPAFARRGGCRAGGLFGGPAGYFERLDGKPRPHGQSPGAQAGRPAFVQRQPGNRTRRPGNEFHARDHGACDLQERGWKA